jgi:nucleoporin POM152
LLTAQLTKLIGYHDQLRSFRPKQNPHLSLTMVPISYHLFVKARLTTLTLILWVCRSSTVYARIIERRPGRPPFQIMYNIAHNGGTGGMKLLDQPTFNSIQPRTRFQLQTSHPGRVYYEVKQIGDTAYPLSKHKNAVIPRSERLLFEQHVSMRPIARFSNRNRLSYCLNDTFVPLDPLSADGTVVFDGTPPFTLKLSIKNLAASHVDEATVEVFDSNWKIDLPSYNFKSIGPHLLTIESVRDASNCAPAASDPLFSSIWVDVAETAAIIPFDRREHFCVGEVSQFQLEGIPPWNIGLVVMFSSQIV